MVWWWWWWWWCEQLDGLLVRPPYQLDACLVTGKAYPMELQFIEHQKQALTNGIDYEYRCDSVAGALTMEAISRTDFKVSGESGCGAVDCTPPALLSCDGMCRDVMRCDVM